MSGPLRPMTTLALDFHPHFRCWWGSVRPDPVAVRSRLSGEFTLSQYAVFVCEPKGPAAERTGRIAVVLDPRFKSWLGERQAAVFRRLEGNLQGLLDAKLPPSRNTLNAAAAVVNKTLNDLYQDGTLWGAPPPVPE